MSLANDNAIYVALAAYLDVPLLTGDGPMSRAPGVGVRFLILDK
jgi:predicted nucleic acid-binding protein